MCIERGACSPELVVEEFFCCILYSVFTVS